MNIELHVMHPLFMSDFNESQVSLTNERKIIK